MLRVRAVEGLLLCRQPKWQVLLFLGVFRCLSPLDDERLRAFFLLHPSSPEARAILERNRRLFDSGPLQPPLRVAGRVYQLMSRGPRKAHVRTMKGREMEEILVSPRIMIHHLPDYLQRLLATALVRQQVLQQVLQEQAGVQCHSTVRGGSSVHADSDAFGTHERSEREREVVRERAGMVEPLLLNRQN